MTGLTPESPRARHETVLFYDRRLENGAISWPEMRHEPVLSHDRSLRARHETVLSQDYGTCMNGARQDPTHRPEKEK